MDLSISQICKIAMQRIVAFSRKPHSYFDFLKFNASISRIGLVVSLYSIFSKNNRADRNC